MNLICGINPVLEALAAGTRHFDRLLVVKGLRNRRVSDAIARAGQMGIPLRFEPRETLDRMASGLPHQGLIAVVSAKPVISLEAILETARQPGLVAVLDGVEDPRNLGAILRTAEAAGVDGVLLPERHSAGLSETVARASAGGLEHVRVARVGNVSQALQALKARGYWVVGFDASGTERWDAVDYRRPVALVLGGEGRGIRRLVREHCDHLVSLPLFGHVGSLNVSVAAGIALYEVIRQRGVVPSHVRPIPARPSTGRHIQGPAAGDSEHDPGARYQGPSDAAHEEGGEESDEHVPTPAGVIDIHEESAWGTGPTMIEATARRHGRGWPKGRGDRRRGPAPSGGRGRPEAAAPSGTAEPASAPSERPAGGPRRRRRRRKGPRPLAPGTAASTEGGRGPADPIAPGEGPRQAAPGETQGPSGGESGGDGNAGPRGRRRRRRRR